MIDICFFVDVVGVFGVDESDVEGFDSGLGLRAASAVLSNQVETCKH